MYEIIVRRAVPREREVPKHTVDFFDVMLERISHPRILEETIQELVRDLRREKRYHLGVRREFQKIFFIHRLRVRGLKRDKQS